MISSLIALIPLMLMLAFSLQIFQQITIKQRAEWCMRQYMLSMEVDGCLTADNKVLLTQRLNDLGVYDLVFDGTTLNEAYYGEKILLSVKGKMKQSVPFMGIGESFSCQLQSTYLGS